jgi:hypothetical protein
MVTADFCDLPPKDYPQDYSRVSGGEARYLLFFPIYLHPEWGREGRRITRLKIIPTGPGAEGINVSLNFVRCNYDVRLTTTNSTLINATHKLYMWSGDDEFLTVMMPRLRRAVLFLNEHIKGREEALLNWGWMVGKDGIGGECGHGVFGSYWDLLPAGLYDLDSSMDYYYALNAMAEMEKVAKNRGINVPDIQVLGPDNKTMISYKETPESLSALAKRVKANIEKRFWNPKTGRFGRNIDIHGSLSDYGWVHFNVQALAMGIGTDAQRDSIVSWLNGSRIIKDDTSTGRDIYHWRFGPRISTKRNENYYYWAWPHDRASDPTNPQFEWGNQMQDGGGVPFTSLFDLMARCGTGRQAEIDKAFERTKDIQQWYNDVKAVGGTGLNFYRKYYDGHPERGFQQSPKPGGLGLDREFLSDGSLGTEFIFYAFLGIDAKEDKVLSIRPAIPSQLSKVGVTNVYYRGNHLTIEAGKDYISLVGSHIPYGKGLKVRMLFRSFPKGAKVLVDGKPCTTYIGNGHGGVIVTTDLRPVRIEVRSP